MINLNEIEIEVLRGAINERVKVLATPEAMLWDYVKDELNILGAIAMQLDEDKEFVYFDFAGETHFNEDKALAVLLAAEQIFPNGFVRPSGEHGVTLYVLCNDIFSWGMADLERFAENDIQPLYDAYIANPRWGTTRWCCIKRNMKPQLPVEGAMRKAGVWDDAMEALPENAYEKAWREEHERKLKEAEGGER